MSTVHQFFPLNVQVLENNFVGKSCSISENSHKITLKTSILLTYHIYGTSKVICTSFFPLKVQVLEENFFGEKLFP